jgi:hypothetical protein
MVVKKAECLVGPWVDLMVYRRAMKWVGEMVELKDEVTVEMMAEK